MFIYSLFSFLGAFCSIGYQITASLLISDLIKNEVIGFHLTVGVFLLGLTLGSLLHNFDLESLKNKILNKFLIFEFLLCVLGLLTIPMIYGIYSLSSMLTVGVTQHLIYFLIFTLPIIFLLGFLSGIEVPLIIALGSKQKTGFLLGVNYIGGLLSSLLVPFFLSKTLNFYQLQAIFVLANCLLFFLIALTLKKRSTFNIASALALLITVCINLSFKNSARLEQYFLKIHYMGLKIDKIDYETFNQTFKLLSSSADIIHTRSAYQTIDFIDAKNGLNHITAPPFTLYLNRDPQFSKDSWIGYHESMVAGAFNLNRKSHYQKLLIIGGGDGLLARVLLKNYSDQIESIDLVELDPAIVKLSLDYLPLQELNHSALNSKKIHIHYEDAFKYVRENKNLYDGIFIDLPYPNSFELLRLYSQEFYAGVSNRLKPDAFVIMDAPVWWPLYNKDIRRPLPQDIIFSTLSSVGFKTLLAYGPIEPFIFFKKEKQNLEFNYDSLPLWLSNRAFMNLTDMPIISDNIHIKPEYINSVFRPKKLRY